MRQSLRRRHWNADLALGRDGEDWAHRYLQREGMIVVARNWRSAGGAAELDLVARDGEQLVFVEVKTRRSDEYGAPERAIDWDKRRHIVHAARNYWLRAGWDPAQVRFDVVSIVVEAAQPLTHLRDAFRIVPAQAL
ncbi:MAG: YraN family protein [Acidobacteriia bacterium]|nr:YraN family protein [Terriglobia bacterium]